jgi:stage II sporulation protein P
MGGNDAVLLRPGSHANSTVGPEDNEPVPGGQKPVGTAADHDNDPGNVSETDANAASESGKGGAAAPGTVTDRKPNSGAGNNAAPTTGGRNVIFIYHSHNRESWFPELKSGSKLPESPTKNITLLGDRLAQKLEANGIGTLHSSTDYVTAIKNFIWTLSYKYSKKTVTEAMATNKDLKFFFDIHRDSLRRKDTTTTINGKSYAQVFFIVGHANPNWRKNEAFASEIHEALDKQFPGISRGIWGKTTASGNGEYNQSVSPDSVLIEIGGVDNTLEESYRTVDALAKVISKLYWDAEKVSAPKSGNL